MFTDRPRFSLGINSLFIFIKLFIPDKVFKFHVKKSRYLHQRFQRGL